MCEFFDNLVCEGQKNKTLIDLLIDYSVEITMEIEILRKIIKIKF